jgi:muramoyltetrapeptide carboxypeptidase
MLPPGARVAVVAPAGIPVPAELEQGISLLRDWGYDAVPGRHLYARHRYNAGTVAERVADLTWALTDSEVDGVWLARGGYGCIHCLEHLPANMPKGRVLVGCSDATSLLAALYARGHTLLIHGPMLVSLASRVDEETRQGIRRLLAASEPPAIRVDQLCGPVESVSGRLVGGNLTVLASVVGTPWAMRDAGAIVLLEDVGEAAYRLDRCVMQLLAGGALAGARAIVLGEFFRCVPPKDSSFTVLDIMRDLLAPLGVPVFAGAEFAHGSRNLCWTYGGIASIRNGLIAGG